VADTTQEDLQDWLLDESVSAETMLGALQPLKEAQQPLWQRCALARNFGQDLYDTVIRGGLPPHLIPSFDRFVALPDVEALPRSDGLFRLSDQARAEHLKNWQLEDRSLDSLRVFSRELLKYYRRQQRASELDLLSHESVTEPRNALRRFESLYKEADKAFDLGRCQALVRTLSELDDLQIGTRQVSLKLLSPELRAACDTHSIYLESRSRFAEEFYQTASYYQRQRFIEPFLSLGKKAKQSNSKWIVHIYGDGGMGKTMLLRWLVARYWVPRPICIPVARIDFDQVANTHLGTHPWLLLLRIAEQLNRQIAARPFTELIDRFWSFESFLRPYLPPHELGAIESTLAYAASISGEVLGEFKSKLGELSAIVILDTTEEPLLHGGAALEQVLRMFAEIRNSCGRLNLVLSGRYNLAERMEYYRDRLAAAAAPPIPLEPFSPQEGHEYLVQKRRADPQRYPLDAMVRKAAEDPDAGASPLASQGANPFRLALIGDIVLSQVEMTEAEVNALEPGFEFLIERIINRIPELEIRWLIRYGAVARHFNREFLGLMIPHLEREMDIRDKESKENKDKKDKVSKFSTSWPLAGSLDAKNMWERLEVYASGYGWLRKEGDLLAFQPEVVGPMRRLLRLEEVFALLNRDAANHFEKRAAGERDQAHLLIAETIFHRFQCGDQKGLEFWGVANSTFWDGCVEAEADPARRQILTEVPIGSEFVDERGEPRIVVDVNGDQITLVDRATVARANLAAAAAEVEKLYCSWSEGLDRGRVQRRLGRAEQIARESDSKSLKTGELTLVRAGLALERRDYSEAAEIARQGLNEAADYRERYSLEMISAAILNAQPTADSTGAIDHLRAARECVRTSGDHYRELRATVNLASAYIKNSLFEAAEPEYQQAQLATREQISDGERAALASVWVSALRAAGQPVKALAVIDDYDKRKDLVLPKSDALRWQSFAVRSQIDAWRLLKARAVQDGLSSLAETSSDIGLRALLMESEGRLSAALLDFPAAHQALETAAAAYGRAGDPTAGGACTLASLELALHEQEDWIRVQRDLASLGQSHYADPAILLDRIHLAILQGDRNTALALWTELSSNFPDVPVSRAPLIAAGLALGLSGNPELDAQALAWNLEQINPPSARGPLVIAFRFRTDQLNVTDATRGRLLELIPVPSTDSPEFVHQALEVADILAAFGADDRARELLLQALEICRRNPDIIALREILRTAERVGFVITVDPEELFAFTNRVHPHGLASFTVVEQAVRLQLLSDFGSVARAFDWLRSRQGTYYTEETAAEARWYSLMADSPLIPRDEQPKWLERAVQLYERLGQSTNAALLRQRSTQTFQVRVAPSVSPALHRLEIDSPADSGLVRFQFIPSGGERRELRAQADFLKLPPQGRFSPLFRDRLGADPEDVANDLQRELNRVFAGKIRTRGITNRLFAVLGLGPTPDLALTCDFGPVSAIPWELGLISGIGHCFHIPKGDYPKPVARADDQRRVLILQPGAKTERRTGRGYSASRINLETRYLQAGFAAVVALHDPTSGELIDTIQKSRPHLIHVLTGLRESRSGFELFCDLTQGNTAESNEEGFSASFLSFALSQLPAGEPRPLIILDPPRPPEDQETATQLLNRNWFANELFAMGNTGGVLATGLLEPQRVDAVTVGLVDALSQRAPLIEVVRMIRRAGGDLLSTAAAALFVFGPDQTL
jgi:hypothetical protein